MSRRVEFIPYHPKTILNKNKHADHWFWSRYSAYPYIGCQHGCEFCYCREQKYSPYDDPQDFAYIIKVKENAPELLRRALKRAPVDVIFTGDYQPLEKKFGISHKILEVCYEMGFPVFILERNPAVTRDLDLILSIEQRSPSIIAFSIIAAPDSKNYQRVSQMERLAPPAKKRFEAMQTMAKAGLTTGTVAMPLLPSLCDDVSGIESLVRWTADHGGKFVLASGLTLSDQQRAYFFNVLAERFPDLLASYQKLYPQGSYGATSHHWREIALRVREACTKYGIADRVPRPIIPTDKYALNKQIVEKLANQAYSLELEAKPDRQIWEFRKAAWAVEDLEPDVSLIYRSMGLKGLQSIPDVGESFGQKIADMIK
jgi:DNA repair photolyase